MKRGLGAAPLLLLWALPLLAGLALPLIQSASGEAWGALFAHPQLWPALMLSLWTATAGTAAALLCTLIIMAGFHRSGHWLGWRDTATLGLALPHLAFAIGFGFLIMPSGWLARLLVGGDAPPQWLTTQDPLGLSLIAVLVLKEIPFFLAMAVAVLSRGDAAVALDGQWRSARSLGHGPGSVWLRVILPQLLARLIWPIAAVWAYGATVVDMALVIGPTQPPPLAVIVWRDLNDAAFAVNQRGLAGAVFLTLALGVFAAGAAVIFAGLGRMSRGLMVRGPSTLAQPRATATLVLGLTALAYLATAAILLVMSLAPRWPYPALWPAAFGLAAWQQLASAPAAMVLSIALALTSSVAATVLAVLWFETQTPTNDRLITGLALVALGLPQLVTAAGQYILFLDLGLTASLPGLFLAHLTPVLAYVIIVLAGPYRALDPRYAAVARALQSGAVSTWWRVKAPLLKKPLLTALAAGFSVSMVQFVPAQLVAAGRFATLPMEAVTLASGGDRPLTAAYAFALALPPLIVFALAGLLGRSRWR